MAAVAFDLIFMGCGSSSGVPMPSCLLNPRSTCKVCSPAHTHVHPRFLPNSRGNPSVLLRIRNPSKTSTTTTTTTTTTTSEWSRKDEKFVIIDVGKTFKENVLRWFPVHKIQSVDAVILTHAHADAMLGLDDLRDVQTYSATKVFTSSQCFKTTTSMLPYLVPRSQEGKQVQRSVTAIDWKRIRNFDPFFPLESNQPVILKGSKTQWYEKFAVTPLPVMHGEDFESMGFAFGSSSTDSLVVYLSDVSRVPEQTLQWIKDQGKIRVLIVDALFMQRSHSTHFNFKDAYQFISKAKPDFSFFTGMSHDFDYVASNQLLAQMKQESKLNVFIPRDGLCIHLPSGKMTHPCSQPPSSSSSSSSSSASIPLPHQFGDDLTPEQKSSI